MLEKPSLFTSLCFFGPPEFWEGIVVVVANLAKSECRVMLLRWVQ